MALGARPVAAVQRIGNGDQRQSLARPHRITARGIALPRLPHSGAGAGIQIGRGDANFCLSSISDLNDWLEG